MGSLLKTGFNPCWDGIKQVYNSKEREIIYAAKDIPVFYYFEFPEIAAFKIYFWNKTLIPDSEYENRLISLEPDAHLFEIGQKLLSNISGSQPLRSGVRRPLQASSDR